MNNQLTVKTNYKGDIRKIRIDEKRYNWLRKSIIKTYSLEEVNFKLVYVDEDEDKITIGNMNDLNLALESVPCGKLLKIYVKVLKDSPLKSQPKQVDVEKPKQGEKLLPLMKLQKPKPQPKQVEVEQPKEGEKLLPLMKLQKPKPQPKQVEVEQPKQEGEKLLPLMKLQKPKQVEVEKQDGGEQPKEGEKLLPLMKLQKPKPQPKQVEVEQPKEGEKLLPLMKLQKPKPQPKQVEVEQPKEGEKLLPLMKLQKPKPQPKEKNGVEKVVPQKPKTEKKVVKKEKIPIVFSNNNNNEQTQPCEFPFTQALNDLVMMGFTDNTQLRSLLISNNGNMEATVNQLLN